MPVNNSSTQSRSAAHLGPFGTWMTGPGRLYDLPALLLNANSRLTALGEFQSGWGSGCGTFDIVTGSGSIKLSVPTLWQPEGFSPGFIPFVFDFGAGHRCFRDVGREQLGEILDCIVAGATEGAEPAPENAWSFKLNFPIHEVSIDPEFRTETDDNRAEDTAAAVDFPTVILGVIDEGIPFANRSFRDENGRSRIDFCWSQSAPSRNDGKILFGREFTGTLINELVEETSGDEDEIYRRAGVLGGSGNPPSGLDGLYSHGAHVLDIAAGNCDPGTRIIAVDLPATSVWDTSGYGKDMLVVSALHYLFDRADRLSKVYGRELPLIVNLSYGFSGGPHDGSSQIEAAIDELVSERRKRSPTALVIPSGNLFLGRMHASITQTHLNKDSATLPWRVQPNDRTSSYLEIWFPPDTDLGSFQFEVIDPRGRQIVLADALAGGTDHIRISPIEVDGEVVGQFSLDRYRGLRWRAMVILAPTETSSSELAAAPAGLWQIKLSKASSGAELPVRKVDGIHTHEPIDCWIQRDQSFGFGDTGARQSYFDEFANQLFQKGALSEADTEDAKTRRFGSMNGMACGSTSLVVGGHVEATLEAAKYSSAGVIEGETNTHAGVVNCSGPTDRSWVMPGVVAAGTRSGSSVSGSGTSVASPVVSRALAELFSATDTEVINDAADTNYAALLDGELPNQVGFLVSAVGQDPAHIARVGLRQIIRKGIQR